jgi:hypothetical protein
VRYDLEVADAPPGAAPRCATCDVALVRLGGATLRSACAAIEIEHFVCPRCGRRKRRHSERGWEDSKANLAEG